MKIHDAYPSLSLEWLMLGDGAPFKSTSGQQGSALNQIYRPENEIKCTEANAAREDMPGILRRKWPRIELYFLKTKRIHPLKILLEQPLESVAENRRVVKIMVFYSDNTFETYSLEQFNAGTNPFTMAILALVRNSY